ncbi:HMG-box domain-containing protein [Sporobolomyces salmoneus]|uniref:HMG-box domain-containing protein n=1 Tax=Sporobolomyces salmoneus TaxID=183962 RepID=UPI0031780197
MSSSPSQNDPSPLPSDYSLASSSSHPFESLSPEIAYDPSHESYPIPAPAPSYQAQQLPTPSLEDSQQLPQLAHFDPISYGGGGVTSEHGTIAHPDPLSALQLSFDSHSLPSSAPASFLSFPHSTYDPSTPPLESPEYFLPHELSSPYGQPGELSSRPSYVQTFRLPGPSTPPAGPSPRSVSMSPSNKRSLHPSPSLSAALSVLDQTPPWNSRGGNEHFERDDSPPRALYTTLEAAVESLTRSPPQFDSRSSSSAKRPKPFRSSTEPTRVSLLVDSSSSRPSAPSPSSKSPSRSKAKKRPEGHVPRAPNAWILYRSARVKELTESGQAPKLQSDISKLIASMWREESAEVKEVYSRKASIEAKIHAEKYPGYCYKPTPSGIPRRKTSKKEGGAGRPRSRTTSALQAHLSGFSLDSPSPAQTIPSVLLPSPFCSDSSSQTLDYTVGSSSSYSYEDSPFTPSALSCSDSTLPSSPSSAASEAWTVFQASGLPAFDYSLPIPPSFTSTNDEPCSAPARVSTSPFSFSQPPPIFEPYDASSYSFESSSYTESSASSTTSSHYSSLLAPSSSESTSNFDDFLAGLPVDQIGHVSVSVSSASGSSGYDTSDSILVPSSLEDFEQYPSDSFYH